MDKLKYIKLEQEDGTYSDSIPLAVDSDHVDVGGETLTEELENLKNDKVNKTDIIDNLNSVESNKVLSANQGKVLGDAVAALDTDIKKKVYYYNSVADMKADLNLKAGDMAVTLGYYTPNDGGKGEYLIRAKTDNDIDDGGSIHELINNLIAELIVPKELKSIVFGDDREVSNNDTSILQRLLNYSSTYKIKCTLMKNKIYLTNGNIEIKENTYLDLNGSTIKMIQGSNTYFMSNTKFYNGDTEKYIENIVIENGTFDGNNNYDGNLASMVLIMYSGKNIIIKNLNVINCQRNPFNFFNSCDCYFQNICFKNICLNESQYIKGGNYCISFEGISKITNNSNIVIENIDVDNYRCGIFHFRNYTNIKINTVKSLNAIDGSLKTIPLTFTNVQFSEVKNVDVDRVTGNGFEINQNSAFLIFDNCSINNAFVGVVFGPNIDNSSLNHDITFNNCKFIANDETANYIIIYNYADNVHFKNCYINGLLGGGSNKASNYFIENSTVLYNDWTKFYPYKCLTIIESLVNDMKFKHYDYENIDIEIPYELTKQSSTVVVLPFLKQESLFCNLKISSLSKTNLEQKYQGNYLYNISANSSDIGQLSELLNSLGSQWRTVIPTIEARLKIKLSTTSDVNLKGTIRLVS